MRKTLLTIMVLLIIYPMATANIYYVAVNGNDSNAGTIGSPWGTWQKAFSIAQPGDTVYFRGGVWYPKTTEFQAAICIIDPTGAYQPGNPRGFSGTAKKPICYFNYPGESPILDCRYITASENGYLDGISLNYQVHYLHFKGLEIRNIYQKNFSVSINGISTNMCSNITFENMSVHNISGRGLWLTSTVGYGNITSDTSRVINCDFYNCADTLETHPFNMGDGIKGDLEAGGVFILEGVRTWNNSDDGIDLSGPGQKILKNCWAFNMGVNYTSIYVPDDGNGFKLGGVRDSILFPNWIMSNCISAGNLHLAVHMLDYNPYYRDNARVYNSIFYKNERGPAGMNNSLKPWQNCEFYNCIAYANKEQDMALFGYPYPIHNCSWIYSESSAHPYDPNPFVTVSDADFVSVDINELSRPRKVDFSLPDVDFMKLAPNSDLIDAGIKIGLPYTGRAPDIGAFETNILSGLSKIATNNWGFAILPTVVEEEALFQFTGINSGVFHLEIYNTSGTKVLETEPAQIIQGANSKQVNLNTFNHGLYLCRLICNNQKTSTIKFVKK